MDTLASLKAVNVKESVEVPTHGIRFTCAEPSPESKLFRVEKLRKPQMSFSEIVIRSGIVGGIGISVRLVDQWMSHPDLRIVASIIVLLLGVVVWIVYSRSVSSEIVSESVLAVRGLGIELFSESRGGRISNVVFIESARVNEVLIIEGFTAMKVITYIGIELIDAIKKPRSLILPFQYFELPTRLLSDVTRGLRQTLHIDER